MNKSFSKFTNTSRNPVLIDLDIEESPPVTGRDAQGLAIKERVGIRRARPGVPNQKGNLFKNLNPCFGIESLCIKKPRF